MAEMKGLFYSGLLLQLKCQVAKQGRLQVWGGGKETVEIVALVGDQQVGIDLDVGQLERLVQRLQSEVMRLKGQVRSGD